MDRTSPLQALHLAAGAHFISVDGWSVPADFGDRQSEYQALRDGAARIDLSLRGKLRLTGPDRVAFLHNMLTNDIHALRPGQGCHAAKLGVQGKMEAGLHVLCREEDLWCDIDPGPAPQVAAALERHLILEDARIEDITFDWAILAVQGPDASHVVGELGVETARLTETLQHMTCEHEGHAVIVVRNDHCGEGGFDVWVPAPAAESVWQQLGAAGARSTGLAALDVRRIEAGIPWAGSEITGETFPMEAGLDAGWISYTKGCYLGQETISRIHHLGHVNRLLRGLVVGGREAPPRRSTVWSGDKRAGEVTSATVSLGLGRPVALAYLHRDHAEAGTRLEVEYAAGDRRPATVAALPLLPVS
jgi:aminomethyltransferase